ncbi:MAG: collagen-like protein [Filomicrobium sp.]
MSEVKSTGGGLERAAAALTAIAILISGSWFLFTVNNRIDRLEENLEAAEQKFASVSRGPAGPRGRQGERGPQGAKGETGERGPRGEPGQAGALVDQLRREIATLKSSLQRLEAGRPTVGVSADNSPTRIEGCLDLMPGDSNSFDIVVTNSTKMKFCWRDGVEFMTFGNVQNDGVVFRKTGGGNYYAYYGKSRVIELPGARVRFAPQKLSSDDGLKARVNLRFSR